MACSWIFNNPLTGEKQSFNTIDELETFINNNKEYILSNLNDNLLYQVDAWHGSPFSFNKFTTSKIGTGEGNQAFGWGLYFTELEDVAKAFARSLYWKNKAYTFDSLSLEEIKEKNPNFHVMTWEFLKNNIINSTPITKAEALNEFKKIENRLSPKIQKELKYLVDNIQIGENAKRQLYKVSIFKNKKPNEYTLLNWDKPVNKKIIDKLLSNTELVSKMLNYLKLGGVKDINELKEVLINSTGETLYKNIIARSISSDQFVNYKEVSLELLKSGIDGIKYSTSLSSDKSNYVIFDENAVEIEENILFQEAKGAYNTLTKIIYALTNPNVTTPIHELAHFWHGIVEGKNKNTNLTDAEIQQVLDWTGHKSWTTDTSEAFAKGFETYLSEGNTTANKGLTSIFEKFAKWLSEIYVDIKQALGIELNDNMRSIYANMLNSEFISDTVKVEIKEVQKPVDKPLQDGVGGDFESKKTDIERRDCLNGVEEIIFSNPNFKLEGFEIDGNYWNVVTSTDRAKVLVNINGVIVPFYLTTGQAGKGLVPGWYPFFGIGKDGWLNKTDKSDMETYYERYWGKETSDIVKSISEELNGFYGTDPSNFKNDGDPNATSRPLSTLADKVEDYINSKLNYTPATNNADARKTLRSNVEQLGKEINAKYDAELKALEDLLKERKKGTSISLKDEVLANIDDIKIKVYKDSILTGTEKDITNFLKEVSEQWYDRKSRKQTERNFGEIAKIAVRENPKSKKQKVKKEIPEEVKPVTPLDVTEPKPNVLTYEKNIDYKTGLDGENQITVIDNEGNMIENPSNDLDGYTFETQEEAKAFIDIYNKSLNKTEVTEIKSGVKELFESNPELANEVYEALGFNDLRKEYSNIIIDQVWKRLANEGITNADSLIGTRDTINNKDFTKFWSAVKDEDIQNVINFFESEKQKALDSYSKYKGEFDPTTGTFTSNDTSFFDNKIKDLNILLQQKQQAQQLYSQYLDTKQDIESFNKWIKSTETTDTDVDKKEEPVEDVFEIEKQPITAKSVDVKLNKKQTAKQGTDTFDVIYNNEILDSILEDISETTSFTYSITGDEINGFNIINENRFVKNEETNKELVFNTPEEAQLYIDSLTNINSSNGWYNTKGEFLAETKNDAITFIIDKYNDDNNLTKAAKEIKKEYINFTLSKGKKQKKLVGELLNIDGKIYTVKLNTGETFEVVFKNPRSVVYATEQEFNSQETLEKPTPKYKKGDKVISQDGVEYTILNSDIVQKANKAEYEIVYFTDKGTSIIEEGIASKSRKTVLDNEKIISAKHLKRKQTLELIAKRFYNLFGGNIQYVIEDMNIYDENGNFVSYPFESPARFNKGVVEINLGYSDRKYTKDEIEAYEETDPFSVPWLKRETVAHEFMHPFVLALKMSNEVLYKNLINELKKNHLDVIAHVDKLVKSGTYEENTKDDEALTLYLGRELTKAFRKNGTIDTDYIKSRPFLVQFINWINDIIDFILGKKKPKTLEEFVKDANINKSAQKEYVQKLMNNPNLKEFFTEKDNDIVKKIRKVLKNQPKIKELLPEEDFSILYEAITNYQNEENVGLSKFEFIITSNTDNYVQFDKTDPDNIKVYIDRAVANENSLKSVLLISGKREFKEGELYDEYEKIVSDNAQNYGDKKEQVKELSVSDINPLMKLNDLTTYLLYQLDDSRGNPLYEKRTTIKFTPEEYEAIDNLVAYMDLNKTEYEKLRERIVKKLPLLKETAEKRLNSDTLKFKYNILNKLNFTKDDTEFVFNYFQHANLSINLGWKQYMELKEDIQSRIKRQAYIKELMEKPSLTEDEKIDLDLLKKVNDKAELTRLNKELGVIRQLMSFYDDFRKYTRFADSFTSEEIVKFQKSITFLDMLREDMENTAINLNIEWFMPYAEEHNKRIKAEGYTDEKYLLDRKKFYDFFKYGTGQDTNYITFWLGSNVTSRDPINAVFSNTISDMLSLNNIDIYYKGVDVEIALKKFLNNKGINFINNKAQVDYYKENYLRDAEVRVMETDPDTGDKKEVLIKKKALHQEYFFDKYELDLYNIRKKYSNPRNSEEDDLFTENIEKWKKSKNYGKSPEYLNKDYAKLKNDEFFKLIEKYYNESNIRYGSKALQFGILPQKYDVGILDKAQRFVNSVKADKPAADKLTEFISDTKINLAGLKANTRLTNFDGSPYREISTDLVNFKKEENINFNLPEIVVDFISESINHESLKETQYQAETLSLLLEGNTKFNINARKFAQEDINAKILSTESLKKAKIEFERLDELKEDGQPYDEDKYKKLKEKIEKGVITRNVWDNLKHSIVPSDTNYNNIMLLKQINDVYFGENQEEFKVGSVSLNKVAHYVSLYTSINNMAGNVVAGVSNINVGNMQLFIEGHGGKYFNKKDLVKASADYIKNIPTFIQDLKNPIKSKDTQLSFILDAIQGEISDEFGVRVTGNIAKKMFRTNSLFLLTQLGEHQIQITGMKAMLLGKKIKTKKGETITLYDAFISDKDGRYSLRKDIDFTQEDLSKFMRDLHGVNRSLNGNYSEFNKTMLARKWYGTLILKFRKYLYPSFRTRFSSEHTDYERNTVEVGYFRYFFGTYMYNGLKNFSHKGAWDIKNLEPHKKYALRKATFELSIYALLTVIGYSLFGGDGDDKKELNDYEKFGLLLLVRLRSDLGMYHVDLPSEAKRQIKTPTASLNTIVAVTNVLTQLTNPNEVYDRAYGSHEKGDSKLKAKAMKLLPVIRQFDMDLDNKLGYYNMINRNIEGVSPKQSNN